MQQQAGPTSGEVGTGLGDSSQVLARYISRPHHASSQYHDRAQTSERNAAIASVEMLPVSAAALSTAALAACKHTSSLPVSTHAYQSLHALLPSLPVSTSGPALLHDQQAQAQAQAQPQQRSATITTSTVPISRQIKSPTYPLSFFSQELSAIAENPLDGLYEAAEDDEDEYEDEDEDDLESAFLPSFSLTTATLVRPPPPPTLIVTSPPLSIPATGQVHLQPRIPVSKTPAQAHQPLQTSRIHSLSTPLGPHYQPWALALKSNTPTLSLSFRAVSFHALQTTYSTLNAQSQLALIFSLPWGGMATKTPLPTGLSVAQLSSSATRIVGRRSSNSQLRTTNLLVSALGLGIGLSVATISCIGCFCVARLILPQFRCFVVVSRQALAKALAAGQQLLAVVLVVREPRPAILSPAIGQSPQSATRHAPHAGNHNKLPHRRLNSARRRSAIMDTPSPSLLAPTTPIHHSTTPHSCSADAGHGELINTLRLKSELDQLADTTAVDQTSQRPINCQSGHELADWPLLQSPQSSTTVMSPANESMPPLSLAFSPRWSPRRHSTFSTSATIVPHVSPPRMEHTLPLRDRSTSVLERASKRFTMNFPVQPSIPPRPMSWFPTSAVTPEAVESPTEGNFLTVLAYQERRVLELRDELERAEDQLAKLKEQWTTIEYNKTQQLAQSQPLTPRQAALSALEGTNVDHDYAGSWLQKEMERRKAFNKQVQSSGRKVFSGSRHTRTLSLLSPDKGCTPEQFVKPSPKKRPAGLKLATPLDTTPLPGTGTEKSGTAASVDDFYTDLTSTPKEVILKTGKQMVGDIKDGFMTFFEDIRQAAIGDEAINGERIAKPSIDKPVATTTRKTVHDRRSARHSRVLTATQSRMPLQTASYFDPLLDGVQGAFWRENGLGIDVGDENSPVVEIKARRSKRGRMAATKAAKSATATPRKAEESTDEWDTWSTPAKNASSPLAASPVPALTHLKSPSSASDSTMPPDTSNPASPNLTLAPENVSTGSILVKNLAAIDQAGRSKRDSGIWSTHLSRIAPSGVASLKHTASQIMADWERGVAANSPSAGTH